jgi:hypothetical protein
VTSSPLSSLTEDGHEADDREAEQAGTQYVEAGAPAGAPAGGGTATITRARARATASAPNQKAAQ